MNLAYACAGPLTRRPAGTTGSGGGAIFAIALGAMTVRIRVARSATEHLGALVTGAMQGATVTGYGLLVAMAWLLLAGRLH